MQYLDAAGARAAVVVAADLTFGDLVEESTVLVPEVAPYRAGALFERELPCLQAVMALVEPVDLLVVDAYVTLDAAGRPGLGQHVHQAFSVPVVGVAKTRFRGATHAVEVLRGAASSPLHVTAVGLDVEDGAELVRTMAGPHRMPTALARVDRLARGG